MKTVLDAVNEFKGEFNNGDFANGYTDDCFVHEVIYKKYSDRTVGNLVIYSCHVKDRGDVRLVCTREEFNQCVEDCSNNKGWENTMNTITDCTCDYYGHDWKCELSVAQTMACPGCGYIPGKPAKPVFTQAMKEAGELPSVGMDCYIDGTLVIYTIVLTGDSEGDFILTPKEGDKYWQRSNIKYIKPIDTRTDKEKISEMLWDLISDIINSDSTINEIRHDILNDKNLNITWSK